MDDLNGLDFSASSSAKAAPSGTGNYYPSLRPTPSPAASGRATPLSAQSSGLPKSTIPVPKSAAGDSFSNLVSFGTSKQSNTLSLQEQQAKLQREKARKVEEQRQQYSAKFGNEQFWDGLGSKPQSERSPFELPTRTTSALQPIGSEHDNPSGKSHAPSADTDDDLFAAFNKDTKVDKSSHYPPPSISSGKNTPAPTQGSRLDLNDPRAWAKPAAGNVQDDLGDDDDPFGLNELAARKSATTIRQPEVMINNDVDDDNDFLGDLGKPVEQVRQQAKARVTTRDSSPDIDTTESTDPWDKAVSELVDMGFSAEQSRRALTESGSGLNIQAAVSWLLNDAHRQAKEQTRSRTATPQSNGTLTISNGSQREQSGDRSRSDAVPAWMRQETRERSQPRRDDSRSPGNSDSDITKLAAAAGSNFLKTANSLWKTSQKKVQKAVSEFQQEAEPSQPKWMTPASIDQEGRSNKQHTEARDVTDEAMMLEGTSRPEPRRTKPEAAPRYPVTGSVSSRDQSPSLPTPSSGRSTPAPRWQQTTPAPITDARTRLNKQALEEQSAQAYVSPARRKKAAPAHKPTEDADLLFGDSSSNAQRVQPSAPKAASPTIIQTKVSRPAPASDPIIVRPKLPSRNIPNLSPPVLANSTKNRLSGTEHFKRGDYAAAHAAYSASLAGLPEGHPITIVLLCNRSLTALKTGEPKAAVSDADNALNIIGLGRGDHETIDLQDDSTPRQMKESWGKALTRKAEALEQMERWAEAGVVWKEAFEAGVGGIVAAEGRRRCEKALAPKPKPAANPVPKATPRPKPNRHIELAGQDSDAVKRMRLANAAAEKADDEKFALSDSVDARIKSWRDGRQDNLRALLGGMDQVLWAGSGWKKVGMHELVMNGKVKINYMKAIAKVHPDKLAQDASVEVQMISAAVFATLNEAWDKFKTDNGM